MQYDTVFQGYGDIILSASMKKGIKLYGQDQSNMSYPSNSENKCSLSLKVQ